MLVKQSRAVERMERKLSLAMGARPRDPIACIDALEEAILLARTDAEAAEWFVPAELFGELADEYEAVGRVDDALEAMSRALELGWTGRPDGRCRLAEILMRAGRAGEAQQIWAQVRLDTPDDVWLYHCAGVEYAALGDHAAALWWLSEGLRIALRTGDPEQLVEQLAEARADSLAALGLHPDEIQARAAGFLAAGRRTATGAASLAMAVPTAASEQTRNSWAWLPSGEYRQALRRWPNVPEENLASASESDHLAYCRRLQVRLRRAANGGATPVTIVPVVIDRFMAWCERRGLDPTRALDAYAASLAADHPGGMIAWPPGRNDPCWCGHGRKYKRCCGAIADG